MNGIFLSAHTQESVTTVLGNSLVILIAFILLLAILYKTAIGPVMKIMEKREQDINSQLDKAKELEETAQQKDEQASQSIRKAQEKAQKIVSNAKETGEKLKEDAAVEARNETLRIRQEAQVALEQEKEVVMNELTSQVGEIATELAKKLLKRELTQEDHQRLIDEFVEGLE